ncbi:MAG: NADH:flavin oxidoreductase/NADH oxidase [Syntrophaceae bacterium]|nr:MAG: NADH:flavin oxidoreductase/NADH oxidase [Syntrophaceae bacterium]
MGSNKDDSEEIVRSDSAVFKPGRIGSIVTKNRLVRAATCEHATDGEANDTLIQIHRKLAQGGVGMIITGITWVDPAVKPAHMTRIDNDSFIPGLRKLSRAVHQEDPNCQIILQLHHPGRQVILPGDMPTILSATPPALVKYIEKHPELLAEHGDEAPIIHEPVAPSAVYDSFFRRYPRPLSAEEVEHMIDAFAEGICRAREAGFDGAEIHAAHGWLMSSFLSPHTNKREDIYGGSVANRTRILRDIYAKARKKVGPSFPILVKFNATDFLTDGVDIEECVKIAQILSDTGFDALEISGGMWEALIRGQEDLGFPPLLIPESRVGIAKPDQEGYFMSAAKAVKEKTGTTVISVGGYRSFSVIEKALESESADFVSLSRPLVRQPDLPHLWLSGKGADRAACISCSACLTLGNESLNCRAIKK